MWGGREGERGLKVLINKDKKQSKQTEANGLPWISELPFLSV